MKRFLVISLCALASACSPPMRRGEFTLLAADVPGVTVLAQTPDYGKACFNVAKAAVFVKDDVFEDSVRDALSKHSGANALVNVAFVDTGNCIEVEGLPAHL